MCGEHRALKQLLEDYYTKIWKATYINSVKASHTKPLIPSIFHRMSLPPLAKSLPPTTPNKLRLLSLVPPQNEKGAHTTLYLP